MPTTMAMALTAGLFMPAGARTQPVFRHVTPNVVWSGARRDRTRYVPLNSRFSFDVYRRLSNGQTYVRLKMRLGRFGSGFLIMWFRGAAAIAEPEQVWACDRADGAAVVHATFALRRKGERVGQASIRAIRLAQRPDWTFFRLTGPLTQIGLGASMQWQLYRLPRTFFLACPDGACRAGDMPAWNNKKPDFNALALYARGMHEQTLSEYIVFDPAQIGRVRLQRWGRHDAVARFEFVVASDSPCVFALGSTDAENAERTAVPRFMHKGECDQVAKLVRTMDWSVKPDLTRLTKNLAEAARLLDAHPSTELRKRHDQLVSAAKQLEPDAAMTLQTQSDALLEAIARKALGDGVQHD
jgi:hypothetical protein